MIENVVKNSLTYQEGDIIVRCSEDKDLIFIALWDHGGGVGEDILQRLATSDLSAVNVHGMGLLISKQICQLHGGKMKAVNADGGFRVEFILPKAS